MQKISLKLSSALHETAEQMARARNLSLKVFLIENLHALVAEYRLAVYKAKAREPLILPLANRAADNPDAPTGRRKELSAASTQQLLHLGASANLTVGELAARFNTSSSNVRRILGAYRDAAHGNTLNRRGGRPTKFFSLTYSERPQP